jgi:hypothetical protein
MSNPDTSNNLILINGKTIVRYYGGNAYNCQDKYWHYVPIGNIRLIRLGYIDKNRNIHPVYIELHNRTEPICVEVSIDNLKPIVDPILDQIALLLSNTPSTRPILSNPPPSYQE